jgi:gas vesicle protein
MTNEDRSGASGVILAFLLGGLTGAALALLYAPRSGRETRERLSETMREGAERGRELGGRVAARGRQALDDAAEYIDTQRGALSSHKERLTAAIDAGRQVYRQEKEKM